MKKKQPPKLLHYSIKPMQDYYHDGHGNAYSVAKLYDAAKNEPVFDLPLAGICLDHKIWDGCNMDELAWHVKKVNDADLSKPILIDWFGSVADGRHRIIKAIVEKNGPSRQSGCKEKSRRVTHTTMIKVTHDRMDKNMVCDWRHG